MVNYYVTKSVVLGSDPEGGNSFCAAHYNNMAEYSPSTKAANEQVMCDRSGQEGECASESEAKKPDTAKISNRWANWGKAEPSGPHFC